MALGCSPASDGYEHWNLRPLALRMVEPGVGSLLSHEAVQCT